MATLSLVYIKHSTFLYKGKLSFDNVVNAVMDMYLNSAECLL